MDQHDYRERGHWYDTSDASVDVTIRTFDNESENQLQPRSPGHYKLAIWTRVNT